MMKNTAGRSQVTFTGTYPLKIKRSEGNSMCPLGFYITNLKSTSIGTYLPWKPIKAIVVLSPTTPSGDFNQRIINLYRYLPTSRRRVASRYLYYQHIPTILLPLTQTFLLH